MKICLKCRDIFQSPTWQCGHCGWKPKLVDGCPSFVINDEHSDHGFEADAFAILYEIERNNFWFKSRNRLIIWAFRRFFPTADNFLEIGCGTGFVLNAIQVSAPQLRVSGSELFSEGLAFAKKRIPNSKLYQMDAKNIPFYKEYSVIGSFDVLEHISDDSKVLKEIHAALKDDGGIILTVPQHPSLWSKFDVKSRHVRRYTRKELLEKLTTAGFQTVFVTSFVTFLLPFMMVSRWKSNSHSDQNDSAESLQLPKIINYFFELVLTVELILIRLGITLPYGGSLMTIAIKKRNRLSKNEKL